MTPHVVDATVLIKLYLPEVYSEECLALLDSGRPLAAPEAAISQIGAALQKRARTGEVRAELAGQIVRSVCRLPIDYVPTSLLGPAAIELATVSGRSFGESLGLVLALREKTPLVTADHRWHNLISTGRLKGLVQHVADVVKRK